MALENCPSEARGLMSGILQQGYSMGYVFAACANLGVGGSTDSWKTVFWIAAGISIFVGFVRICFPESKQFIEKKEAQKAAGLAGTAAPSMFWKETKIMLKEQWKMVVYCIILMTWFNCSSHSHYAFSGQNANISQSTPTPPKTPTPPSCSPRRSSTTPRPPAPPS